MKGIILAGGFGTRLAPITSCVSKHLLPVFDKPMVYYPLSVLMLADIRVVLVITTRQDLSAYQKLLGDGSNFGMDITFATQDKPSGVAQAFIIGEHFIGKDNVCLILGDNIFWGPGLSRILKLAQEKKSGATIFAYQVIDPERFGVVEFDGEMNALSIEEKPVKPKSNSAVTGLYFYDNQVLDIATEIKPSERGELEITDVNKVYMQRQALRVECLGRGFAWMDAGTFENMLAASKFIEMVEKQHGYKVACLEEIAFRKNWIDKERLLSRAKMHPNNYGKHLLKISNEFSHE